MEQNFYCIKRIQQIGDLKKRWSMNWIEFKDSVFHICLAIAVIASWSLEQEVADSSPFTDKYFCHWIQWKHLAKTRISLTYCVRIIKN